MTMAEDWLPALPAVPVSMVRKRAITMCFSITAWKWVRITELKLCSISRLTSHLHLLTHSNDERSLQQQEVTVE